MLELIAGAGIFAAGWLAGRISRKPRQEPEPVKAICGCDHHVGMHKGRAGRCQEMILYPRASEYTQCLCQVYSGPELITSYTDTGVAFLPPASEE